MSFYPQTIAELFRTSKHVGSIENPAATGSAGAPVCGAVARLSLEIHPANHLIADAKFRSSGCGYAVAAMELLCTLLIGTTVPDAASLLGSDRAWNAFIVEQLGEIEASRSHCLVLARDTLAATLRDHRSSYPEHAPGEEALICTCFFVSERTIETAVRDHALTTIDDVTRHCRAGGGCGSCHPLIAEIIEANQFNLYEGHT
jgi:NifU-like protein